MLVSNAGSGDHPSSSIRRSDHRDSFGRRLPPQDGGEGVINHFDIARIDQLRRCRFHVSSNYNAPIVPEGSWWDWPRQAIATHKNSWNLRGLAAKYLSKNFSEAYDEAPKPAS
jgi:hypothetical protein